MLHLPQLTASFRARMSGIWPVLLVALVQPVAAGAQVEQPQSGMPAKVPSGAFLVSSEAKKTETSRKYSSDKEDVSAVLVTAKAQLSLFSPSISTTGETSSPAESRTRGLNAAVLATKGGLISISGGSIVSTGSGASAAQAIGADTKIAISGTKIVTSGDGAHGGIAADGANLSLTEADIEVAAAEAAGITADQGGTVLAVGCVVATTGPKTPALDASGTLTAGGGTYKTLLAHGAQVRAGASLSAKNISLTASRLCGVLLYSDRKDTVPEAPATLSFEGGLLSADEGPALLISGTRAEISLSNVSISAVSGVLLQATAGQSALTGAKAAQASVTARQQLLVGDTLCDGASSLNLALQDKSALTGKIVGASLSLDSSSTWTVTGDSVVVDFTTAASTSGGTIPNVRGNGHTVRYKAGSAANQWLNGRVYKLADGGTLEPAP